MRIEKSITFCLFLALAVTSASAKKDQKFEEAAKLTPQQSALIEKAVAREKITIKQIRESTPVVETYIQNLRGDIKLGQVPISDTYFLSRVDFAKTFEGKVYDTRSTNGNNKAHGFFKGSLEAMSGLTKALHLDVFADSGYDSNGFLQMMFLDPTSFDQQHYVFGFVGRKFVGDVRTWVFDVHPKPGLGSGRFFGRIWIEDHDGNVVRFKGSYTTGRNDEDRTLYFDFDSWRAELQPGLWLPVAIFIQNTVQSENEKSLGLNAQTHFWGYSLKLPTHDTDENTSIRIDNANDSSNDAPDIGPLQASRNWVSQAEENVLDRLVIAGMIAPPSDVDKNLEALANNLIYYNNLALPDPIHVRIMLTMPVEAVAVGNTILLSKGLVDTAPKYPFVLGAVVAYELAHIVLGHHIDTKYAFNDRLLFPDTATFSRIYMLHTDMDNKSAVKKALELIAKSDDLKPHLQDIGLYFAQMQQTNRSMPALMTPRLGDSLLKSDGTPWLSELTKGIPKLDMDNLDQQAAMPLGSVLKIDAWSDKVYNLKALQFAPLSARDKLPFQVTPINYKLTRYVAPADAAPATPAAAPATTAPAATDQNAQPATTAPAATPTAAPPADKPADTTPATTPANTSGQSQPAPGNN